MTAFTKIVLDRHSCLLLLRQAWLSPTRCTCFFFEVTAFTKIILEYPYSLLLLSPRISAEELHKVVAPKSAKPATKKIAIMRFSKAKSARYVLCSLVHSLHTFLPVIQKSILPTLHERPPEDLCERVCGCMGQHRYRYEEGLLISYLLATSTNDHTLSDLRGEEPLGEAGGLIRVHVFLLRDAESL